jgi:uncharacterized SAM-binding protein YcdF (DUF218 family)
MKHLWRGLLMFFVLLWLPGLLWFYTLIPTPADAVRTVRTDAIVVLTGGMGRVEQGIELLKADRAKMLLISGVDKDVKPAEIVAEYGIDTRHPVLADGVSRMVLDYGPRDTVGNARETAKWMQANGLRSVQLVTSSYHMPRSVMEFHHAMPQAKIVPSPVFPEWTGYDRWMLTPRGSLRLILLEYHKYALRKLYYLLPEAWQFIAPRTSTLHPMADVGFATPVQPPAEESAP